MAKKLKRQILQLSQTRRGLFGSALWIFCDTLVGIVKENTTHMPQIRKAMLRAALVALGLLMVPLVASRVVEGWNWPPGAFVFTYVLFFGTALAYALIARKMGSWAYKAGVGVALVAGFALGWSNMVSRWVLLERGWRGWRREVWLTHCSRWRRRLR